MPAWRPSVSTMVVLVILHTWSAPAGAVGSPADVKAQEMEPVTPLEFAGDLRHLASLQGAAARPPSVRPLRAAPRRAHRPLVVVEPDASVAAGPLAPMPSPTQSFAGLSRTDNCGGVSCGSGWPPDTNGDVGLNHYIQAVNSAYAIYNKTGTLLAAFTEDQLWSAGGANPCNGDGSGDPIVLYDQLADRWILTHFAFGVSGGELVSPFFQCIAVSKTNDPVAGGWWLYPVRMDPGGTGPPVGALNDYAKFGIWPDCLYMAANEFQLPSEAFVGTAFASFNRADLYSGAPLRWALGFINNATNPFTMIPSNLLGKSLPTPGTPNYFVSESETASAFEVRKFTAGPNCGAGGTLSGPTIVTHASYVAPADVIVPQPGTTNKLDSIDDRLMQKVQYRKVGSAESLWVVHNVRTSPVTLQWAQLDVTGGVISTTPVQQQIYAPDTTLYRWMGSLAVDNQGNMALGYSTSSSSAFPSIAYSGRLATDPLNTLPQSEVQLVAGAGSQTNTCGGPCGRWGDYSAMSVDPADDCTFWYTNQYYSSLANGATGNWQTRIGSFKFPSCQLAGSNVAAVLPLSRSVHVGGAPATAFAVIINAGSGPALNCAPAPPSSPLAGLGAFTYQTTSPANVLTGTPNTPANIGPGATQNYVFGFAPTAPFAETSLGMQFLCSNTGPAPSTPGVNNFFLVASASPVPDTVALIATLSGDGVVHIPGAAGLQVFAIGTANVGVAGTIVVSADTGGVSLPLTLTVCATNSLGICMAPPTPSVTVSYAGGTTRSFAFFAQASGSIPFSPALNRVFARLREAGVLRGATSAAVCTIPNAGC